MNKPTHDGIRQIVRTRYQQIAVTGNPSPTGNACCSAPADFHTLSASLGYSSEELNVVPEGANLGLGCGNPQAIAGLQPGEHVLDLGSGGGFDCFLASRQVGTEGSVIGVDMTPEMVSLARENAIRGHYTNTSFRLGEIEHLPVADASIDVIISNCVINLSPDKQQVFREAFRVLVPGGRLAISDMVTTAELPPEIAQDLGDLYSGCISGASSVPLLQTLLANSGFIKISVEPKDSSRSFIKHWVPGTDIDQYIASAVITAVKPHL